MNMTSKEIAERCGVSRGTVDRALNDRPGIHPATKEKIIAVAQEYGYRPHFVAQSLVKGKTLSIGAVVFDLNNRLFPQLMDAMETEARKRGYFLYLTLTNKNSELELECLRHLTDRRVDGILLMSVNQGKAFTGTLERLRVPIVTFGNRVSSQYPYVWIDDRRAIEDAVRHLHGQGYERIVYVSPPLASRGQSNIYAVEQRFKGFQAAARKLKLETAVVGEPQFAAAVDRQLALNGGRKTAILCSSDTFALQLLVHFRQTGIRVPEDVGLMGFDNIDTLQYVTPALTTVSYSSADIGRLAVETLIRRIEGEQVPAEQLVSHRLVHGESC